MSHVTLTPRQTSPHADGIRLECETSSSLGSPGPIIFTTAMFNAGGTDELSLFVGGNVVFKVSMSDLAVSGAGMLAPPAGPIVEILSGRLILKRAAATWPVAINDYLTANWFADLNPISLAIGNDGLQLEVQADGKRRIFRWAPVRIGGGDPVFRARWLELTVAPNSFSEVEIPIGNTTIRRVPLTDGTSVVESYLQRTTLAVESSRLVAERPSFGLNVLGHDWFPSTCWSWSAGGKQVFEFVDVEPGDWEPLAELKGDLKAHGTTSENLQLTQLPPLLTTGRTANETSELPAAWQYAGIKSNNGGSAPGVWVHWNLSLSNVPSRLAVQATSLDSQLHGLWAIDQLDWKFEFGLRPQPAGEQGGPDQHQTPPRIRLRLTKGAAPEVWSATLVIANPQVFGSSPELQFFGRAMTDVRALPHAPDLARSLTVARVEFANVEFTTPDKFQVSARLDTSDATTPIKFEAGPQAVEAWVPGPWAGLTDVSLTGTNLPADLPGVQEQTKLDRDRNQGLVDVPLTNFALRTSEKALAQFEIGTLPASRRTGPAVATLLPWLTWTVTGTDTQFDIYHRNLQLEHFEQQLTQRPGKPGTFPKSDGIMLYPVDPMFSTVATSTSATGPRDSDDLLRVEMEYDRVRALRDRFVRAADPIKLGSSPVEVKNWFHSALAGQVSIERPTALETPPQLKWNITPSSGEPANESLLQVGSDKNILEAAVNWPGAVVQDDLAASDDVLSMAPVLTVKSVAHGIQSAGFLTSNGHVPPLFRTAAIRCLDAAEIGISGIGQVLLVVYVDNSNRTFAWFPSYWKQPRQLTDVTDSAEKIRIVLTIPKEEPNQFMIATVTTGVVKIWQYPVVRDAQDLPTISTTGSMALSVTGVTGVTALHSIVAQVNNAETSMLVVGTNDGQIRFYKRSDLFSFITTSGFQLVAKPTLSFGADPIDRLDFRNQAVVDPRTQTLLAGTHNGNQDKIHVAIWLGNDLLSNNSLLYQSENPPSPAKKCPNLIVPSGIRILGMALQGFDAGDATAGTLKDELFVWGIIADNDGTKTCQWKLALPATDPNKDQEPKTPAGDGSATGFVPAGQTLSGEILQLGFGDRTELASRFLVAVTAAGTGQTSSWVQWEPDWDLRGEHVPTRSFFQVPAHRGPITGASVVPLSAGAASQSEPRRVVLATGGEDGAVIVWDVASAQELYRWQPRDWLMDLGGVRLAGPKGKLWNGFYYVERVGLNHVPNNGNYIVFSTSPPDGDSPAASATSLPLTATASGADLNFLCHNLLLSCIANTNTWELAARSPQIAIPLGTIGIHGAAIDQGNLANISHWPTIGNHPFYPTDVHLTFSTANPLDDPQPQQIVIKGVLLNLVDVKDIMPGQVPWFVNHAPSISITLQASAAADGKYDISKVEGEFDWTFPLSDQLPPPSVARSVPGRLQSLSGTVGWDTATKSLLLTVNGGLSRGDALGRTWTLTQQFGLKLESPDAQTLILRESLTSGTLLARRTLPHLKDKSKISVIEHGRGPNGDLLALTASNTTLGDLFVSEVDTGRRILQAQDRYRDGVLALRGPVSDAPPITQQVEAVLIHVDGTVRVWPAFSSTTSVPDFPLLQPQAERRRLQPDSAVEAVVVFDGQDKPKSGGGSVHHRLYLLRCADGSARLWDDVDGEVWQFDLPDTTVTAIAMASTLGSIEFGSLAKLHPTPDQVTVVTTVMALGGADGSVRCYLIEEINSKLKPAPLCFFEDRGSVLGLLTEVTSLSLAFNPQAIKVGTDFFPGLFLLACSRNGDTTPLYEVLSGDKPLSKLTPPIQLAPLRARLTTSGNSLFIAAENIANSVISVEIYKKEGDVLSHANVNNSNSLSTLAICSVRNSTNAIFAAGEQKLQAIKIETLSTPITLNAVASATSHGDQAISLISVEAGNALLAIDGMGKAKLYLAKDVSPLAWTEAKGFVPASSQQVIAATFAETSVRVALRVSAGRIEVWDLDFDSRRWVSPESLGNFTPADLHTICFQFLNGRPILAVGRVNAVEFWNLSNNQLEHRLTCGGKVVQLDLKVNDRGEPQVLMTVELADKSLSIVRGAIGQLESGPRVNPPPSEYRQQFVRGAATNLAVMLERVPDVTTPANEILRVKYWNSGTPTLIDILPGEANATIVHFDAVNPGVGNSTIVLVVKLSNGKFASWVIDSGTTTATKTLDVWTILDAMANPVTVDIDAAKAIQTHEFKPGRTVLRKFDRSEWKTTETIDGTTEPITRSRHQGAEDGENLRLMETNWPVIAAISVDSDIRLWDRLSGVLRQTWRAQIQVSGTAENLKPLSKGLLGIPSGIDPSLLVAGEQGLLLYRFRFGNTPPLVEPIQQIALGWEPTTTTFPLAVAWNASNATTCRVSTLTNFLTATSITAEETGLTGLTLSWQPVPDASANNGWHLAGQKSTAEGSFVYALQHPDENNPVKAHQLGSTPGRILAMAWPTAMDQGPVRVLNTLRRDPGPRRDVSRLLLAVDDTTNTLELRDMVLSGWMLASAWKTPKSVNSLALVLVDDDLGVRLVAPLADEDSAVTVLVPTPWLRISLAGAPQLDLQVKLADPTGTAPGTNNFIGHITRDRHFELDIAGGTIPQIQATLVARPALVQGYAYTFNLEPVADSSHKFLHGALVLWETTDPQSSAGLQGTLIWETCDTSADINVTFEDGGVDLSSVKADLRALMIATISQSQIAALHAYVTGIVSRSTEPLWELHIAEQPLGAAFAFLFQTDLQGFVPVEIQLPGGGQPWAMTVSKTLFAADALLINNSSDLSTTPQVRDDVFLPVAGDEGSLTLANGRVVDLAERSTNGSNSSELGILSVDMNRFAFRRLKSVDGIPLDMLGGIDSTVAIPKQGLDVPQLVHRRDLGGRLRAVRNGFQPLSQIEGGFGVATADRWINPVMTRENRAAVLFETLSIRPASPAPSNSVGSSHLRTESVMVLTSPELLGPQPPQTTDIARNLLTATTSSAAFDAGVPRTIFNDDVIRSHALQVGATGILLKRTLDATGQVEFTFVNSPYHALEPQTLSANTATSNAPGSTDRSEGVKSIAPHWLTPGNAAKVRQLAATKRFEHIRPTANASSSRTLRFIASSPLTKLQNQPWRVAIAEHTLFDDFDCIDEDESAPVAASGAVFLPTDVTLRYGIDKPGATQLHQLRAVVLANNGFVRSQSTLTIVREHQQIIRPAGSNVEILNANLEDPGDQAGVVPGVRSLFTSWKETVGSEEIGALSEKVDVRAKQPATTPPQYEVIPLNGTGGTSPFPPLAVFERVGERLIHISPSAPVLIVTDTAANPRAKQRLSIYLVSKFDLSQKKTVAGTEFIAQMLFKKGSTLSVKPLTDFFTLPAAAETGTTYFVAGLVIDSDLLQTLQDSDSWNIAWAPVGDSAQAATVFKTEGTVRTIDPSELQAARLAAVWRSSGNDLFGNTFREQTVFYGESASSQFVRPQFRDEKFELIATGSEKVGLASPGTTSHLFVVKTLGNGETLRADSHVSS